MYARAIVLLVLAFATSALAMKEESIAELTARAQAAPPDHQAELYVKVAQLELKAADDFYNAGKVDDARSAINALSADSEKATEAATHTHKRLKNTEIDLRKMSEHLRDLKGTLNFEDQAPVQTVIDHLEALRTRLLNQMFGKAR
ncbi:MAG TPA: hypothetical protein VMH85_19280 [Terriglobales bacterium]|nr:hypothetical protein [Terriglobales bacterium]